MVALEGRLLDCLVEAGLVDNPNAGIKLPEGCKRVKIDVGLSHNAPCALEWLSEDPDLVVIGFEPVIENISALRSGTSPHPLHVPADWVGSRLFLVPCALGDKAGEVVMHIMSETGQSSLLKPQGLKINASLLGNHVKHGGWRNFRWRFRKSRQATYVATLDEVLAAFPFMEISYITHLKTDCQGTDINVLRGALNYLSRIMAVTAEPENRQYVGSSGNSEEAMTELLHDMGFIPLAEAISLPQGHRIEATTIDPTFVNLSLWREHEYPHLFLYQNS